MDVELLNYILKLGPWGVLIIYAGYIVYKDFVKMKSKKEKDENAKKQYEESKTQRETIVEKLDIMRDRFDNKIENLSDKFDNKINCLEMKVDDKIDIMQKQIDAQPENIIKIVELKRLQDQEKHNKQVINQINLGPKLHKLLGNYLDRIKCDHMFLGSLHNGTSSLSGIPYCKFDIIAERFNPIKVRHDVEFAFLYKDSDIIRHDKLPIILNQNNSVFYKLNPDDSSELKADDDILYRRLLSRGIKQLSLHMIRNKNGVPVGFVGFVCYDYYKVNNDELHNCAKELESIYEEWSYDC